MKKRLLAMILAGCIFTSLTGCGSKSTTPSPNAQVLDNKKIIFIGSSYTYWGGTVFAGDYLVNKSPFEQEARENDQGYFYQICKANGVDVNVTDWTFDAHGLPDIFGDLCSHCNINHLSYLTDLNYDYVVLQGGQRPEFETPEDYFECAKSIMDLFREANPDVKLFYVVHDGVYVRESQKDEYDLFQKAIGLVEAEGATIIDWGTLVWDVISGTTSVPGGKLDYNKNSFIVSRNINDGYHPNPLSGYINALMTYCTITGDSAVGQDYTVCTTENDDYGLYNLEKFKGFCYTHDLYGTKEVDERETNYIEIFNSPKDMKGLQKLIDKYITNKAWLNYVE